MNEGTGSENAAGTQDDGASTETGASDQEAASGSSTDGGKTSGGAANEAAEASDDEDNLSSPEESNDIEQGSATSSDTDAAFRMENRAWEDVGSAVALSSDGIAFTEDEERVEAVRAAVEAMRAEQGEGSSIDPASVELPDSIPARLNLQFALDPSASSEGSENAPTTVVPGDTLAIDLPTGFEPSAEFESVGVYQRDDEGNATAIRIGSASFTQEGTLLITFQTPVDEGTGTEYAVGETADGAAAANLATLSANIDFDVEVSSSLIGEEAAQIVWEPNRDAEAGHAQDIELAIPSKVELLEAWGISLETAEAGESGLADLPLIGALMSFFSSFANTDSNATDEIRREPGARTASLVLNTSWADNNDSLDTRPSTDAVQAGYQLTFTIDGDSATYRYPEDAGKLALR